ncbi:MAG: hypothetical protein IPH45_16355 [Bacteroidales bacterium]|nr:hypothetical protein [Bacteroidales bacterium]MBK7174963.1 hypothetical protein [Bacteroidales bacterium]
MTETSFTENNLTQEGHPQLTPASVAYLAIAAKWGKFLAILGFISIGFVVLAGLSLGLIYNVMGDKMDGMGGIVTASTSGFVAVIYVIFGVITFIPLYFLNSFSNNITKAIRNNNTTTMTTALKRLKSLFVFIGIYTVAMIAMYIIVILVFASRAMLAL